MKMDFKTKFRNKIRIVNKKGLKQTLFTDNQATICNTIAPTPMSPLKTIKRYHTQLPTQTNFSKYSQGSCSRVASPSKSISPRKIMKTKEQKLLSLDHQRFASSQNPYDPHSPPLKLQFRHKSKDEQHRQQRQIFFSQKPQSKKYIDEMIQKHQNLLKMIDFKTKYRMGQTRESSILNSNDYDQY